VTVCRLAERRKNVDLVLHALSELKDRYRFTYTLVGDGATRESLQRLTNELGLGGVVRIAGRVSQEELVQQLVSADLFILTSSTLPSSHEGFGIAYLEANAAGAPVLAARLAARSRPWKKASAACSSTSPPCRRSGRDRALLVRPGAFRCRALP